MVTVASIPEVWAMTLPRSSFIVGYGPRGLPPYDYLLKNVARTTPVSAILEDINVWLAQLNVNIDSTQLQLAMPSIPDDFETMMRVPPSATAEEADLFNRYNEVVITTFPLGGLDGADLRRRIGFASQGAGGRTRNVSHNDTLNNILACDHSKHTRSSLLDEISPRQWKTLRTHLEKVEQQPDAICHNCGMLCYPCESTKIKIKCDGHDDLRAWRVFSPMIQNYARARNRPVETVFLCEPAGQDSTGTNFHTVQTPVATQLVSVAHDSHPAHRSSRAARASERSPATRCATTSSTATDRTSRAMDGSTQASA